MFISPPKGGRGKGPLKYASADHLIDLLSLVQTPYNFHKNIIKFFYNLLSNPTKDKPISN